MNSKLSFFQKINIYRETGLKVIRGFCNKIFLKESKGFLFVGKRVSIHNREHIRVGRNVKFEALSEIQGLSTHDLVFGNYVTIGYGTQIRPSSYYGVGQIGYGLTIGNHSSIGPMGYLGCAGEIKIGEKVMIGPKVTLVAENHIFKDADIDIKNQGVSQKGIIIENNVWIGTDCTILDGVTIGEGSVIGAGCLITKDVPNNSIVYDKRDKVYRERLPE
ncbi:acyltransferase [Oenococcus oeni]|uniref:Galactoside O-acetyltransferase n=2 Tax=Lactobacillales TaxID=186826 RepID=Q04DW2_OENOB|nr:acyltransferase [Oenococcus oeni]ABJ57360.1 Galactoside O-acetyltransferase [Oenococcus oeni PSU-1]EJO03388.1 galactoside O-acetyltransferase [Oenococcus oeni AWRIB418]KMQ39527.1 galactoside O-acetyltransferase [Oenococcus oeni]OIK67315.1 galactoside O-acetyltransferase [Oenococcus oeni]OIL13589.1 galactoside O-acetyltransferase [Oenococcus oeni]